MASVPVASKNKISINTEQGGNQEDHSEGATPGWTRGETETKANTVRFVHAARLRVRVTRQALNGYVGVSKAFCARERRGLCVGGYSPWSLQ